MAITPTMMFSISLLELFAKPDVESGHQEETGYHGNEDEIRHKEPSCLSLVAVAEVLAP